MAVRHGRRVVIVGGGPAAAAAALTLARRGLVPVVLEAQPAPQLKVGECLPPSINPLLARLGLVEAVGRAGRPSYGDRFVWARADPAERDFLFGTTGVGWQLDRRRFEEELSEVAIRAGADWRFDHRLIGCSPEKRGGHRLRVQTQQGVETYQPDFVIDASGRTARLAHLLGQRRVRYDRLVAVVTYFHGEPQRGRPAGDASTLVEAVADGWWYSAPLPDGKLVAAYLTDADLLGHARPGREDRRNARLEAAPHTRRRIHQGRYAASGPRRILGAQTSRLSAVAGEGWLAAGDAAVAHDPLTSYGITAALGWGLYAGTAAADYLGGHQQALRDYARLMDRAFAQYLVLHHDRYLVEQRWPDSTFWRRRHCADGLSSDLTRSRPEDRPRAPS